MNRDDIIRMAREVGGVENVTVWLFDEIELERFAALVAAAEREACAKVCDAQAKSLKDDGLPTMAYEARYSAAAIRARGSTETAA